jgi:hypothetical protein
MGRLTWGRPGWLELASGAGYEKGKEGKGRELIVYNKIDGLLSLRIV